MERQGTQTREHTLAVIDCQWRPDIPSQAPTVDQLLHLTRMDSTQQTMAIGRSPLSHPMDTEIQMVISIELLTEFLVVSIVEIQHTELENARHGPTSSRRRRLNQQYSLNPMSDR